MNINELAGILNGYFSWNKSRMACFATMLIALIKVRTVNLTEIACGFSSCATQDSRYTRIKRFFREFHIDFSIIASWIIDCFSLADQALYLCIDRTNWCWGKKDINILMLSVVYKGIALPLFWMLLAKRGNSDTQERIRIIQRFTVQFGKSMIAGLLADREFIGGHWFGWLLAEKIAFCIRIKNNVITTNARGLEVSFDSLFYDLKPGEQRVLQGARKLWGQKVYLSALRLNSEELLILATDHFMEAPIQHYALRWEIETLFSCLKGRGFNFEDTRMTKLDRVEKPLVLLSIAFCLAYKTGEWKHEQKAIKIKKHGRKAISYFRYGLDLWRDIALNGNQKIHHVVSDVLKSLRTNLVEYALT